MLDIPTQHDVREALENLGRPDGAPLRIERGADGELFAAAGPDDSLRRVTLKQCFPWSHPGQCLSLLDDEGSEVALIPSLAGLAASVRILVAEAAARNGFTFEIRAIRTIEEEYEIFHWTVDTTQGVRQFQTKRDEWPHRLDDGRIVIHDVCGDLYVIARFEDLDRASRRAIWPFLD